MIGMTKPFSMRELIARCARRCCAGWTGQRSDAGRMRKNEKVLPDFGSPIIDPAQRTVSLNGKDVHLTPTEFDLLATLARKPKSVLTCEKLLEEV